MALIIIISYILNVFLNRWLDKLITKNGSKPVPFLWFFSLFATVVLFYVLICDSKFFDWFTGKHW